MMKSLTLIIGLVLLTNSSYAQWATQDPGFQTPHLGTSISMVNPQVAWLGGLTGDFSTMGPWALSFSDSSFSRTTDGVNWQMGYFPTNGSGYFSGISAVDENTAFIIYNDFSPNAGGTILRTTDGGLSWDVHPLDVAIWVSVVHAFDANHILVVGDNSLEWIILLSEDGGNIWNQLNPASLPMLLPGEYAATQTFAAEGDEFWFSTSKGRVMHSEDQGHLWEVNAIPTPTVGYPTYPDCLACRPGGVCVESFTKYTNNADTTSYHRGYLFRTMSNGLTWQEITPADNYYAVAGMEYIPGSDGVLIASFRHNNFEGPFQTRISYDDGDTWMTIDEGTRVYHFDFTDPENGYASEYENDDAPTEIYRFNGSPLLGLLRPGTLDAAIDLFPNPAAAQINISVETAEQGDFWVLINDMQGRLWFKYAFSKVSAFDEALDVTAWPAGVYSVTISNANSSVSKNLIIAR